MSEDNQRQSHSAATGMPRRTPKSICIEPNEAHKSCGSLPCGMPSYHQTKLAARTPAPTACASPPPMSPPLLTLCLVAMPTSAPPSLVSLPTARATRVSRLLMGNRPLLTGDGEPMTSQQLRVFVSGYSTLKWQLLSAGCFGSKAQ